LGANTGFKVPCELSRWRVEDLLTGFTLLPDGPIAVQNTLNLKGSQEKNADEILLRFFIDIIITLDYKKSAYHGFSEEVAL
jgi:hypothetical protein